MLRLAVMLGLLVVSLLVGLVSWLIHRAAERRVLAIDHPARMVAERHGGRLRVPAAIRGEDVGWLVVDTGAHREAVTPEVVESLGLARLDPPNGEEVTTYWAHDVTPGRLVVLDDFVVGGRRLSPRAALVIDSDRLPSAPHGETVGLLGRPGLGARFRIDFSRNVIDARLGRPAVVSSAAGRGRRLRLDDGSMLRGSGASDSSLDIPIVVIDLPDGGALRLAIDTGQREALMLTSTTAARLDWPEHARYRHESPVVEVTGRLLRTPALTILGHEREPFLAWAPDIGTDDARGRTIDGRLGTNAFDGLALSFDLVHHDLLVEGTPRPIPDELAGLPRVHENDASAPSATDSPPLTGHPDGPP